MQFKLIIRHFKLKNKQKKNIIVKITALQLTNGITSKENLYLRNTKAT